MDVMKIPKAVGAELLMSRNRSVAIRTVGVFHKDAIEIISILGGPIS